MITPEVIKLDFLNFIESFFAKGRQIPTGPSSTRELKVVPNNPELSSLRVFFSDSIDVADITPDKVSIAIEVLTEREGPKSIGNGIVDHDFETATSTYMFTDQVPVVVHCMNKEEHVARTVAKIIRMIVRIHKRYLYETGHYLSITFDSTGNASIILDEGANVKLEDAPVLFRVQTSESYYDDRQADEMASFEITGLPL